jgi:hypothetical protein
MRSLAHKFLKKKDWAEYYIDLFGGGSTIGWPNAKDSIGKLVTYCRSHGIALIIANLPELQDVRHYDWSELVTFCRMSPINIASNPPFGHTSGSASECPYQRSYRPGPLQRFETDRDECSVGGGWP